MRYLALLPLVALSISLHAQTGTSSIYAMESSSVSAQLINKIDTKNAKVGDGIFAETTRDTRLSDGSRLPRGTKLAGKVTEVHAKSNEDKSAHLAFVIDRAILRDHEVALHATLMGMAGPDPLAPGDSMDSIAASGGGGTAGAGASVSGHPSTGGAAGSKSGGAAPSSANSMGKPGIGALDAAAEAGVNASRPVADVGTEINSSSALQLNHVPVANLSGVVVSSSLRSKNSCFLDASGRNITLESGTRLNLNVIAVAQ